MAIIVLLMWTFIALGDARIYEPCELARKLSSLGVDKELLATWVCIAYHESRYDTAARNPHSGDHGLLQISEIYWCGPGKACGVPCSAFRDDDISDDVQCAHQIHKEHTRLQGDGFMAWVVYQHHCKHNAKKYLAGCEGSLKDVSVSLSWDNRARSLFTGKRNVSTVNTYYPHIDKLKPPYLSINSLLEASLTNYDKENSYWRNQKIDNIDSLKLPVFKNDGAVQFIIPPIVRTTNKLQTTITNPAITKPTITTIDPYLIEINPPMPRKIESNQFRRKMKGSNKNQIIHKDSNIDLTGMYSQSTTPSLTNDKQEISKYKNEYLSESNMNIPPIPLEKQKTINRPETVVPFNFKADNNYHESFTPFYNRNTPNVQSSAPTSSAPKDIGYFSRIEKTTPKSLQTNNLYETKSKGLNGFDFSFKNLTERTLKNVESDVPYKNIISRDGSNSESISSTKRIWPYITQTTTKPQTTTWSWRSTHPSSNSASEIITSLPKSELFSTSNWSSRRNISSSHLSKPTESSTKFWRISNQFWNNPVTTQKITTLLNPLSTTSTTPRSWSWQSSHQTQKNPISVITTVPQNNLNWSSRKDLSQLDLKTTTPSLWSRGFSRQSQSNYLVTTAPPKYYTIKTSTDSVPALNWQSKKIPSQFDSSKTIKSNLWSWGASLQAKTKSTSVTTTTPSNYHAFKTIAHSPQDLNEFKNTTAATTLRKTSQLSTKSWRYVRPNSNNVTETTTKNPLSTTPSIYRWASKKSTVISDTPKISEVIKLQETTTTGKPSIFDLYLRPQKGSPYAPFQFPSFNNSRRFQIFAGGTTASPNSHW